MSDPMLTAMVALYELELAEPEPDLIVVDELLASIDKYIIDQNENEFGTHHLVW